MISVSFCPLVFSTSCPQRWGQLVEKTNGQKETDIMGRQVGGVKNIDSKYNLWAIPGSEIDINAKLTQNPGW